MDTSPRPIEQSMLRENVVADVEGASRVGYVKGRQVGRACSRASKDEHRKMT